MEVLLFHSMFGLRAIELAAAKRLRSAGYHVRAPDLFAGATAAGEVEAGFALMDQIGWATIVERARDAARDAADDAVMVGFSMGVGVIGALWPYRLSSAAVVCLHAPTVVPADIPRLTPVQLHVASNDPFAPPEAIAAFTRSAAAAGAAASVHEYPGAGHFYTDTSLADYDEGATIATWRRMSKLLSALR